jgi:hypothetical protein
MTHQSMAAKISCRRKRGGSCFISSASRGQAKAWRQLAKRQYRAAMAKAGGETGGQRNNGNGDRRIEKLMKCYLKENDWRSVAGSNLANGVSMLQYSSAVSKYQ